jgi:hypothetical protein
MKLGDPIKTFCQPINAGTIFRMFKTPCGDPSPLRDFGGATPFMGKIASESRLNSYIGNEWGNNCSICNKNSGTKPFARKGKMFRMNVEIDQCPWPNGEEFIWIGVQLTFTMGVGGFSTAPDPTTTVIMPWARNTALTYTLGASSGSNGHLPDYGYPASGSASASFRLSQQFIYGSPNDPCATPYVQLEFWFDSFPLPADIVYGTAPYQLERLPCDHWSIDLIQFPGGPGFYTGANFSGGDLGLLMAMDWSVYSLIKWTPQGGGPLAGEGDPSLLY